MWEENLYPPIQAGELLGVEIQDDNNQKQWIVAMVRWLKHDTPSELRIGIRKLSKKATAAAAQIVKDGKEAGYYLRCLILENGILTPTLPFKQGSQVLILPFNSNNAESIELLKLRSATGSYKLFDYKSKETSTIPDNKPNKPTEEKTLDVKAQDKKPADNESFDSIWSNL